MLHDTLNIIKSKVDEYLRSSDITFVDPNESILELGNIAMIDAFNEDFNDSIVDKVVLSLVNIEQDKVLRNGNTYTRKLDDNGKPSIEYHNPTLYLNLYILFSAHHSKYLDALKHLSAVIEFFQKQVVFDVRSIPELDDLNIDKLIFDLYTMQLNELNQLWSILGGKYIPSVLYKVRIVPVQNSINKPGAIITSFESEHLNI